MNETRAVGRLFFVSLLLLVPHSLAEFSLGEEQNVAPPSGEVSADGFSHHIGVVTSYEFWLSILVVSFGVFVIATMALLLLKSKNSFGPNDLLKLFTITTVVVGTLLALTAGFSSEQIAPAMGLFGTIVGYMLGQSRNSTVNDSGAQLKP